MYIRSTNPATAFYLDLQVPDLTSQPLRALVDSGASDNFIDSCIIPSDTNLLQPLPQPVTLQLFDGSVASSGRITHFLTLPITFPSGEVQHLDFFVTPLHYSAPLVLGFSWLQECNPRIDWKNLHLRIPPDPQQPIPPEDRHILDNLQGRQGQTQPIDVRLVNAEAFHLLKKQGATCFMMASRTLLEDPPTTTPTNPFPQMTPDERKLFDKVVPPAYHDFADVFAQGEADILPPHRPYDHSIDLEPDTNPPYGPIYSLSETELHALRDYLDDNLRKGFIRPSNSPAGAPILFAKKKDGSLRLCVDYRGLNRITRKNRYPLPLINDLLDRLKEAKIFTKLDLRAGYNNVRIASGHEWKTAFRTRYGSFEYMVMPFGMTNSPATFQHFMNDIFRDMADDFVVIYLDDILIFSLDPAKHEEHVRLVLDRLRQHNLHVKPEKCQFHTDTTEYLGFIVSPDGVAMDPAKTSVIRDWPTPRNLKEVQSFLGFANFYRRFIDSYSKIVKPLTNLTQKDVNFIWSNSCESAFQQLKLAFQNAPVLAHFDPSHQIIVETDASDFAIGSILSQLKPTDNDIHPIAFHSRTMTPAERNYDIHDKELLAIVDSFQHWRHYLEGARHRIEVFSDHENLQHFLEKRHLNRRQARWSEFLGPFDFHIHHRAGRLSQKVDVFTRRRDVYPRGQEHPNHQSHTLQSLLQPKHLLANLLLDSTVIHDQINQGLTADQVAQQQLNHLTSGADRIDQSRFTTNDQGQLLYNDRLYVPDSNDTRLLIVQSHHDHALAGHPGIKKTIQMVKRRFDWPGLDKFVTDFVKSCPQCRRAKAIRHKPFGPLRFLPIPDRPWSSLSMDFIEGLPPSATYDSILVVVDRLTKMALFIPTHKTLTSPQLARLFIQHVFSKHGVPTDIVSDRGRHFISRFWADLCASLKIKSNLSTAYHPETDGQTERVNQILEQYLRLYTNYQQDDWVDLLPLAEFAYNNTPHSATSVSPFFANKGFHPNLSIDLTHLSSPSARQVAQNLSDLTTYLQEQLTTTIDQYRTHTADRRLPIPDFKVGDLVWLDARNIKTRRPMKKLDHKRLGPFPITEIVSTHARRLGLPLSLKAIHNVFHVSLLEPHHPNPFPTRDSPPPPPIEVDDSLEWEVDEILDSRLNRRRRRFEYLVSWSGYHDPTWESRDNLSNAQDAIDDFHQRYPQKPQPTTR